MSAMLGSSAAVIGQKEPGGTALFEERPQGTTKDLAQAVRRKPQADVLLARGHEPVPTALLQLAPDVGLLVCALLRREPGHGRVIEEEVHGRVRAHLALDFREDIAEDRANQTRALEQTPQLKRLHAVLPQDIHIAVKDAVIFAAEGELVQRLPNTQLQDGQGLQVHVGVRNPLRVNPPTVGAHLHMARMIGHADEQATERALVAGGCTASLVKPAERNACVPAVSGTPNSATRSRSHCSAMPRRSGSST